MGHDGALELPVLGTLPSSWEVLDFASILDGGTRNGIYKPKEFHGSGVRIVNMGELFAHPRLHDVPMKRVQLSRDELARFGLQAGDLLYARRSLVAEGAGKCSIVVEVPEPTTFESSIIRARPNPDVADSSYLFYLFRSPYGSYVLDSITRQVAVAGITGKDLERLPIPLPPLPEQRAIARILGALDDKIELNRRMNATLEAIARALFQSWFVDFDPVRARAGGRHPAGMDAATAALFPDAFEESSLGMVPQGWQVRPLDSIARFLNGLALQRYPPRGDDWLPAIKIADLRRGDTEGSERAGSYIDPEYVVEDGDILFSWSGSLEVEVWCGGRGALNQHLFKVTSSEFPKWLCFHWLRYHLPDFRATAANKATTMGHIQRHHLTEALVVVPPSSVVKSMDAMMLPLFERAMCNNLESRTLAAIRDALLPKLLSGEVRVREAEALVEAAI